MKIDRVILSATNNPMYYDFWNPVSKVYNEKFGIRPTLVWLGTEEELTATDLNFDYGDLLIVKPHPDYGLPFQSTWALYWATQFYQDEVCFICGIDEVPLSGMFLRDIIAPYSNDDYVMTIADAYLPNHWTVDQSASPSGQHCAKGKTYDSIYQFNISFKDEIEKVVNAGVRAFWEDTAGRWGLDETYFSLKLRQFENKSIIKSLNNFALMCERRIECERHKETEYDLGRLQQGWYSQAHLCRPFSNHVNYITKLYNDIPKL
jgi:hypothetical protein